MHDFANLPDAQKSERAKQYSIGEDRGLWMIEAECADCLAQIGEAIERNAPEEEIAELEAIYDALEVDATEKVAAKVSWYQVLENRATFIKGEEKRLADMRNRAEKKMERVKASLDGYLRNTGKRKMEEGIPVPVSFRRGGPALEIEDEEQIPVEYWKVEEMRSVDTKLLTKDLKGRIPEKDKHWTVVRSEEIPGAKLVRRDHLKVG